MDEDFIASLRTPLAQIAGAMIIAALIGAFGFGAAFESFFGGGTASPFVRESLAVSACCLLAFGLTAWRIGKGQKPIDLHIPPSANLFLSAMLVIAIGYLIGTTVFR